jgi:class 3 adenylate cyclase
MPPTGIEPVHARRCLCEISVARDIYGMAAQPTGTVTMLFTDIEGSTRLLERLGRERYAEALELHRRLLRAASDAHDGYVVDYEGDAFFVAFSTAEDGVAAAAEAQRALAAAEWPEGQELHVRMGIHTGEPLAAPPEYVGLDVHRTARIMAAWARRSSADLGNDAHPSRLACRGSRPSVRIA